jgi:hypothetical protein
MYKKKNIAPEYSGQSLWYGHSKAEVHCFVIGVLIPCKVLSLVMLQNSSSVQGFSSCRVLESSV